MLFRRNKTSANNGYGRPGDRPAPINISVVGVGGGGGNAVLRMADDYPPGVKFLALNTDIQALRAFKGVPTFAIGPNTTAGMGSGGQPDVGRKAMRESQNQAAKLLENTDMVFVTAGLGGGTGTGAASIVADLARKRGALTVGVVTLPFAFEGPRRREVAMDGLKQLSTKVDTLITIENDRLLRFLKGKVKLSDAFQLADRVLKQGVHGIADIISMPGLINVDFADVKSVMANGGRAFMAIGEGQGRWAALEAAQSALANPLFSAPLDGASGILFNVKGGNDLALDQVHEVAGLIRKASSPDANVIFGVTQDPRLKKRVKITLVATGVANEPDRSRPDRSDESRPVDAEVLALAEQVVANGHSSMLSVSETQPMF
jgi:cell division protein FtsZ